MSKEQPWIGVDLDGTLAYYDGWSGVNNIGDPLPEMVKKVKTMLAAGNKVKIFTARVAKGHTEDVVGPIRAWTAAHLGVELEITHEKDYAMILLYDDRCRQVITNTGRTMDEVVAELKDDRNGFQQFFLDIAEIYQFPLGMTPSMKDDVTALLARVKKYQLE